MCSLRDFANQDFSIDAKKNINAQHYHTVREVEVCTFDPDKITFPCRPKYLDSNATLMGIENGIEG